MNRTACCALLLGCALAAPTSGAERELEIRLAGPGGLTVRCGIPIGSSRLVLIGGEGPGGSIGFAAGLDGPFVRAGPLAAAGLLREAAGPLGFSPGTEVTTETTGLRLDGSFDAHAEASVQVAMLPEVLAVFWLQSAGEAGALGCTLGPGRWGPLSLEATATVSRAEAAAADTAWLRDGPSVPPGLVAQAAARIRLGLSDASAAVSAGVSAAERAPPGWFAIGVGSIGRGDCGIDLLAAAASPGYLELGGGDDPGGVKAGLRLRLAGRSGRCSARYVLRVDAPGLAARPFLRSVEDLDVSLSRQWVSGAGTWEAGLRASNRIENGIDGDREDDPSGRLSIDRDAGRFRVGVAVDVDRDDGIAMEASFGAGEDAARTKAGLEARCAFSDGPASLLCSLWFRLTIDAGEATVRAGIRDAPLVPGGLRDVGPWFSFGWAVRTSDASAPAADAP